MTVELLPVDQAGRIPLPMDALPAFMKENCAATATYYKTIGFHPPWIGYIALANGQAVGGGAFKGAPQDNRVEIAYYTVPEFENQGYASATARELVRIARAAAPQVIVAAQTLPTPNASNALLKKLGFTFHESLMHPEDGNVWEWRLNPADAP